MAELLLVPAARLLVALPDGLDPVRAAPLTDAGLTPFHAVRRSAAKLGPAATAVVIGVGGLGHLAVQILKATTDARVVAVDTRPAALDLAVGCGADYTILAGETTAAEVWEVAGGHGADVVLDFVGSDITMRTAVAAARTLGDLTVVGIARGSVPFGFFNVPYEVSLQTTYWGSREELSEVLKLGAAGKVRAQITTFRLEEATDAYGAMATGNLAGRAVIVPNPT
jgi:propanol-preferring alcohol dehydrogenase